jgi:hypothetical protein
LGRQGFFQVPDYFVAWIQQKMPFCGAVIKLSWFFHQREIFGA